MKRLHMWRATLRIARRDAWRAKGRSALVVAMIALPIIGATGLDVALRSAELDTGERLAREMGTADAHLLNLGFGEPIEQEPLDRVSVHGISSDREATTEEDARRELDIALAGALTDPPERVVTDASAAPVVVTTATGVTTVEVRELPAEDPLTKGMLTLLDGRFPSAAGEVAVTEAFLKHGGLKLDSTIRFPDLGDGAHRITGVYEMPSELNRVQLLTPPGTLIPELSEHELLEEIDFRFLVSVPGGVPWDEVLKANEAGWLVTSRLVHHDPPPDDQVPAYSQGRWQGPGLGTEAFAVVGVVVALVIMEICLLAGPAFAVGARRSRRMLGLVGANGGDRRHIRAIMLGGGLVLGLVAAVVGVVLGILLMLVTRPWLEGQVGTRFGSLDLRPLELAGIGALAVLTGLIAALIPALLAARTPVLQSLTGRRGVRRAGRVLPLVGAAAFVLGAALALLGGFALNDPVAVGAGAIVAQLGLVAMTPVLVGMFGRLGRFLPLGGRLALRDAVRNRSRTAPAVAAVLAAVAGSVTLATYYGSDEAQREAGYKFLVPYGTVILSAGDERALPALSRARETVEAHVETTMRADLGRLVADEKFCEEWERGQAGCGLVRLMIPVENRCDEEMMRRAGESIPWLCERENGYHSAFSDQVLVGGPEVLRALGMDDRRALDAVGKGKAVVFHPKALWTDTPGNEPVDGIGGEVVVALSSAETIRAETEMRHAHWEAMDTETSSADTPAAHTVTVPGKGESVPLGDGEANAPTLPAERMEPLPAVYVDPGEDMVETFSRLTVLVPPTMVYEAELPVVDYATLWSTGEPPTDAQWQAVEEALRSIPHGPETFVERGYLGETEIVLLIIALFAGVVTVGAAGIATGLARADSEADLATLAAVGAPPGVRRTLMGMQCAVIAGMGVVLGSMSGLIPGIALVVAEHRERFAMWEENGFRWNMDAPELVVVPPFGLLALMILVLPLLAGVLAAVLTRSGTGLVRRAE
ncbi:FtsX-like permease family protein [Streptomyces sp. ST2-7A]|uniref:FtsX-like permease family protein n=1 Tax=Streptomyces sp. ST2-7A TaxID=2907214 RepID=UPI001F35E822|nr:FtsX-like permease family protein [Streptomyces sp. ST2-7A]MCE7079770.1 FtsX-like permease family protein [Streptomyces sp. ST2-7A]